MRQALAENLQTWIVYGWTQFFADQTRAHTASLARFETRLALLDGLHQLLQASLSKSIFFILVGVRLFHLNDSISVGLLLECSMLSGSLEGSCVGFIGVYTHLIWLRKHVAKIEAVLLRTDSSTASTAVQDEVAADEYDAKLPAIRLEHASFKWPASAKSEGGELDKSASQINFKLVGLDVEIERGELAIVRCSLCSLCWFFF